MWDELYQQALEKGWEKLQNIPGVITGFHSTIDGLKRVDENLIAELLKQFPELKTLPEEPTSTIGKPLDFLTDLLVSIKNGLAYQRMIEDEKTFNWVLENIGYDYLRLGGTSANMASLLSPLPIKKILVYANPLTKELAQLFPERDNIFVLKERENKPVLLPPKKAWDEEGVFAIHWILEYEKGLKVKLNSNTFESPRANRFIAAWNPINCRLKISEIFKRNIFLLDEKFSHFLVSGFHILLERYPEGKTCKDFIIPVASFVKEMKERMTLKVHYEFASIGSPTIRKNVISHMFPIVDSLGCNEIELLTLLNDLGGESLARSVRDTNFSLESLISGLLKIMKMTTLKRIQLHTLGHYIVLTRGENDTEERDALLFAAVLAATRCLLGRYEKKEDLYQGLQYPTFPLLGYEGIRKIDDYTLIVVPTKVIPKPKLTVGLGDIISSSGFLLS
ncbi:MAG: ADP-dependent glucokinase/phosphofructokinase [bacterium]